MVELEKRKGAGGKLSRSETVTVRLDPKLRYLAELASRKQRRTLSSYIEWAIEKSLESVVLEVSHEQHQPGQTLANESVALWDVGESERFVKLAISYPDLLTHEEQERWKMLSDSRLLSPARVENQYGKVHLDLTFLEERVFPILRQMWGDLVDAHDAGRGASAEWVRKTREDVEGGVIYGVNGIPSKRKKSNPVSGFDEMSDDIPF
jgi:hypothetical protein